MTANTFLRRTNRFAEQPLGMMRTAEIGYYAGGDKLPPQSWHWQDGQRAMPLFCRVGKTAAGRLLDGVLHDEYPEVER